MSINGDGGLEAKRRYIILCKIHGIHGKREKDVGKLAALGDVHWFLKIAAVYKYIL